MGFRADRETDPFPSSVPLPSDAERRLTRISLVVPRRSSSSLSRGTPPARMPVPRSDADSAAESAGPETCATCGGRGQVEQVQRTLFGQFVSVTVCPECLGRGKIVREKCPDCGGRGQVRRKHKLEVKVPAGVERGTRLRITGAGEAGVNGGPQGDLYLLIDVKPDKAFERDGADLHTRLLLTYPQAVLGTEVEVSTLIDGVEKIAVPAGTSHGQVLKVRGKGMPRLRGPRGRGDLYVHVFIDIPSRLTDRQRELITELAGEMKTPVGSGEPGLFEKFKKLFE
ncbi:MAG: DnaJ C-terminal domain-containing protein [Fretibacterium sp.]